jgi:hypothetical protein
MNGGGGVIEKEIMRFLRIVSAQSLKRLRWKLNILGIVYNYICFNPLYFYESLYPLLRNLKTIIMYSNTGHLDNRDRQKIYDQSEKVFFSS